MPTDPPQAEYAFGWYVLNFDQQKESTIGLFDSCTRRSLSISASFRLERIGGEGGGIGLEQAFNYLTQARSNALERAILFPTQRLVIACNGGKVDEIPIRRSFHFFSVDLQVKRMNWNTI